MRVGSDVKSGYTILTVVVDILPEREVDKISNPKGNTLIKGFTLNGSNLNVLCPIHITPAKVWVRQVVQVHYGAHSNFLVREYPKYKGCESNCYTHLPHFQIISNYEGCEHEVQVLVGR